MSQNENYHPAAEGIYKAVNKDLWFDSQQVQFLKGENQGYYGQPYGERYKFGSITYNNSMEVLPINNTLINKFGWKIYKIITYSNSLNIRNKFLMVLMFSLVFVGNILPRTFYFLKQKFYKQ